MQHKSSSLTGIALQRFKKIKTGVLSFWYIVLCGFVAVFCYILAPDNSSNANQMHLEVHSKPPGFTTDILSLPNVAKEQSVFYQVSDSSRRERGSGLGQRP